MLLMGKWGGLYLYLHRSTDKILKTWSTNRNAFSWAPYLISYYFWLADPDRATWKSKNSYAYLSKVFESKKILAFSNLVSSGIALFAVHVSFCTDSLSKKAKQQVEEKNNSLLWKSELSIFTHLHTNASSLAIMSMRKSMNEKYSQIFGEQ